MDVYMDALGKSIDMIWQVLGMITPFVVLYVLYMLCAVVRTYRKNNKDQ